MNRWLGVILRMIYRELQPFREYLGRPRCTEFGSLSGMLSC